MSVCIFYQKHPKLPYNSLTFKFCMLVFFTHFPIVSCTEPQWPEKGGVSFLSVYRPSSLAVSPLVQWHYNLAGARVGIIIFFFSSFYK